MEVIEMAQLPFFPALFTQSPLTLQVPIETVINFLLTISICCQEKC